MSAKARSGYIIGPFSDAIFLIGAPAIAFAFAMLSAMDGFTLLSMFIVISPAHLFLVLYRATNKKVFSQYPWRFTVVPVVLFLLIFLNRTAFQILFYVTVLWDAHHGYMQTFGIGRLYDAKAGNDPTVGRRLDMVMNGLLYMGPIIAGASVLRYVDVFSKFDVVETIFFSDVVPAFFQTKQGWVMYAILAFAIPFSAYYVWRYWQLSKQGYNVSPQKVSLLVFSAIFSLWAWGFNPYGKAFFIQNIYHAMQYFAIVWWSERKSIQGRIGMENNPRGPAFALLAFLLPPIVYGIATMSIPRETPHGFTLARMFLCAALVIECMHFWWDGFIWSVRKKEVASLVAAPAPSIAPQG